MRGDLLKDYLGKTVVVGTHGGDDYRGRVVACSTEPTIEIEEFGGRRVNLAAPVVQSIRTISDKPCEHCRGTGVAR